MSAPARRTFREIHGVVVSAGLMQKTVKVRVGGRVWNNQVHKHFNKPETHLVHDPNGSLRAGDIVAITPGSRASKHKRHVVKHIIAPFGTPAAERPPVPSEQERWAGHNEKRAAKDGRRAQRRDAAAEAEAERRKVAATVAAAGKGSPASHPAATSIEDVE